jgi:alpha-mannosidase
MKFYQNKNTLEELAQFPERIERLIHEPISTLDVEAWTTKEPVVFAERTSGRHVSLRKGEKWGELFDCGWFHFSGTVPEAGKDKQLVLLIDLSGETLVVDEKGDPLQGLTTTSSWYDYTLGRPGKRVFYPPHALRPGDRIDLWADAGNNDLFGMYQNNGTLVEASVAVYRPEMMRLFYDYEVLHEFMKNSAEDTARYQQILYALWRAKNVLITWSDEDVRAARAILGEMLSKKNGDVPLSMSAIGHSHLDLAWLWPVRETIRKGARTFSTVLRMMEQYPDYRFCASQAQLYAWMKQHYPALYQRVQQKIVEKKWEVVAPTWVEADTNVTTGESLVRQFLYGKRFIQREFGLSSRVFLLPDSFGYSGVLPQLMKLSGVDYMITTKLTWDRFNTFPHSSFFWKGIDGSSVLVHLPPEGTYNSSAAPRAIRKGEKDYVEKSVSDQCLLVFGIGDGGGGPGVEHLERLDREKNLQGLPPVRQEFIHDFVKRLEKDADRFHTWHGELFLACHQGTYTTQARNKRFNRESEVALRNLEILAVIAGLNARATYPSAAIERIWKEVLLYQFHDILPGSSITRVYEETGERYPILLTSVQEHTDGALTALQNHLPSGSLPKPMMVVNTLSWDRREWVKSDGVWHDASVPSMGYAVISRSRPAAIPHAVKVEQHLLENDVLHVEFADDGSIASIYDKEAKRHVQTPGETMNQLMVFDDKGDAWDYAWDYENRLAGRFVLESTECHSDGPRGTVIQKRRFGSSTLTQRISLCSGSRRLEFATTVDWQERGKMLRAKFPVAVRGTESVSEVQFGHIRRPAHRGTSWDWSKYEIPALKWIDLADRQYGVALLKDCKYGHRVIDGVMDIHLLRSPSYPDPVADLGAHEFTYALYPHRGDHIEGGVIKAAYEMNYPVIVHQGTGWTGAQEVAFSFVKCDGENVIVEAVKKAEDSNDVIVRCYEAHGIESETRVSFGVEVTRAELVNLLEETIEPLDVKGNAVILRCRPFEIKSVRVEVG